MTRANNQRTVILLTDFARKKAGDTFTADGLITSSLVSRKVARNMTDEEAAENAERVSEPVQPDSGENVGDKKSTTKSKKQK